MITIVQERYVIFRKSAKVILLCEKKTNGGSSKKSNKMKVGKIKRHLTTTDILLPEYPLKKN